jgi:hypothetical protein
VHAVLQHTLSTHVSPELQSCGCAQNPPWPASGSHIPPGLQCADTSQPPSSRHIVGQVGVDWLCIELQNTAGYGPHELASSPAQPESSATVAVPHWFCAEHVPSTRVPWHVLAVLHTGAWSYALQSLSAAQQSPLAQQNPFWQWPLWHSAESWHTPPFASSGTQLPPPLQYAFASHSASLVHASRHAGAVCVDEPVQYTGSYGPQFDASVDDVHAESSSTSSSVTQMFAWHAATSASPSHADGDVHTGGVEYEPGQSVASAQQSPLAQQNPFWQCPLWHRWSSVPHAAPSGRSCTHCWPTGLHHPPGSHCPWPVQIVGHTGGVWFPAPVQYTLSHHPQSFASTVDVHAESSATMPSVVHTLFALHTASPRLP